jgi:hypothetical protein
VTVPSDRKEEYPKRTIRKAITALETVRPDIDNDVYRGVVDDALFYLYCLVELHEGVPHPYPREAA